MKRYKSGKLNLEEASEVLASHTGLHQEIVKCFLNAMERTNVLRIKKQISKQE